METTSETTAVGEIRRAVEAFAAAAGFDPAAVGEIGLAVNEAVANVIRHAYRGQPGRPIVVTADWLPASVAGAPAPAKGARQGGGRVGAAAGAGPICDGPLLRITIRDWGTGVDPSSLPPRRRDPNVPGGLGLICLGQLMDSVIYSPQPDGMSLTMTKRPSK